MKIIKKLDGWCAVVALQSVSGLDAKAVVGVCEFHGFDPFHGMEDAEWQAAAKELKIKIKSVRIIPQKLRRFVHKHPKGTFLLGSKDHLLAVREGKPFDPIHGSLDIIIKQAWRVL